MKKIAILGSTGSIGESCLKIVSHLSSEFQIVSLAAYSNIERLEAQIKEYRPETVAVFDKKKASELQSRAPGKEVLSGVDGITAAAVHPDVDLVVVAMDGISALIPTAAAIEAGKDIALATKEVLVSAGGLIMQMVKQRGIRMVPIDSEHSALFQCLLGESMKEVKRLILTCSGGPLRDFTEEQLENVTVEQALCHPNWSMGEKVTVDSSTLMNKGLEVIEAYWLFQIPLEAIDVVIHPQSIVHGIVEFVDGSLKAQLGKPNMTTPIQYALTYPKRRGQLLDSFDLTIAQEWTFKPVSRAEPNGLSIAIESLRRGLSAPAFMNAANEALVRRFLKREISWKDIMHKLNKLLSHYEPVPIKTIEDVTKVEKEAFERAAKS